jgi:hypothetical protein
VERVPHVSFKGRHAPDSEFEHPLGASLGRALEGRLRQRFSSVQTMDNWRDSGWVVNLEVNGKPVEVYFGMFDPEEVMWLLAVAPLGQPGLLARAFGRKPRDFSAELQSICTEVHALLTSTPGLTDIHWFFAGPPGAVPSVAKPEQLSWA